MGADSLAAKAEWRVAEVSVVGWEAEALVVETEAVVQEVAEWVAEMVALEVVPAAVVTAAAARAARRVAWGRPSSHKGSNARC